jgi:hypothetical protein
LQEALQRYQNAQTRGCERATSAVQRLQAWFPTTVTVDGNEIFVISLPKA